MPLFYVETGSWHENIIAPVLVQVDDAPMEISREDIAALIGKPTQYVAPLCQEGQKLFQLYHSEESEEKVYVCGEEISDALKALMQQGKDLRSDRRPNELPCQEYARCYGEGIPFVRQLSTLKKTDYILVAYCDLAAAAVYILLYGLSSRDDKNAT